MLEAPTAVVTEKTIGTGVQKALPLIAGAIALFFLLPKLIKKLKKR